MSTDNLSASIDMSEKFDSIACVLNDSMSIDDAAAKHGVTSSELLIIAEQNETEVNRRAAIARADGRAIEGVGKKVLSDALHQLADRVDSGDMSAPMLVKVIEVLHKVSGMASKADQKQGPGRFVFSIHLDGGADSRPVTVIDGATAEIVVDE